MSAPKHTPGPWVYKPTSGRDYGSTIYWVPSVCHNIDKEANARLIAAAPDLLEVLNDFPFSIDWTDEKLWAWSKKARAAIAKATGGAV